MKKKWQERQVSDKKNLDSLSLFLPEKNRWILLGGGMQVRGGQEIPSVFIIGIKVRGAVGTFNFRLGCLFYFRGSLNITSHIYEGRGDTSCVT